MSQIQSMIGKDKVLSGVDRIVFVPWEQDPDTEEWKKADAGIALDSIVADTTSITQDEAETNAIDCETRDEPIIENITLGSYQFSCESASIALEVLKYALGFTVVTDSNGKMTAAYAPASYQERWAEVEVMFKQGYSMVLPKIKLSSNIDGSSLKTGVPRGIISGTAYTAQVEGDGKTYETPFYMSSTPVNTISENGTFGSTYKYKASTSAPTDAAIGGAASTVSSWSDTKPAATGNNKVYRVKIVNDKIVEIVAL